MTQLQLGSAAVTEHRPLVRADATPNHIYGYETTADRREDVFAPPRSGVRRIDCPGGPFRSSLALFAPRHADIAAGVSATHLSAVYLWGRPSHAHVRRRDLLDWCAGVIARERFDQFRDLLGTFVILVEEPRKSRITLVSDVLGIRPLFTTRQGGRFIFGSDVWALVEAGLVTPKVDYDAVSAWLAYGFNCTSGSLFEGVRRVPPGAALVVERGRERTVPYATFHIGSCPRTAEQAADDIHGIVSSDVQTLLSEERRLVVPLSGGFDSRYLLALSVGRSARIEGVVNVKFSAQEGVVANRVADVLHVPVETVPVERSVWDLYDDVHHFMADGFPISKFVTFCVARKFPGIPMMNGFIGDSLVRGSNDTCEGQYEDEGSDDLTRLLQKKHLAVSLNLFRQEISSRMLDRSRPPMAEAVTHGGSKAFAWGDLYLRQRHYISNNFLQHLDVSEAILPFYSWRLIQYKLAHTRNAFTRRTYERIFSRHVPYLSGIPHSSELPGNGSRSSVSACSIQWARQLMHPLMQPGWLSLLSAPHCLALVSLAASRLPALNRRLGDVVEDAVFTCRRLYLLERRLREASLTFDWRLL